MNFHHLAYWQDKALSLAIENRLFINGEYTAAAENETFETVDPVTQAPLAKIARGKSVDIDRAMSAARGVFERGDWSLSSPAKRKAVLNKLADLMEAQPKSWHCWKLSTPANRFVTVCVMIFPARRAPFAGTPKRSTKCMAKWRPPVAMSWR